MRGTKIVGFCLIISILMIAYCLFMGAVLAFLWNWIVVDTLQITTATLNLWTGIGLAFLLGIIGGFFKSVTSTGK